MGTLSSCLTKFGLSQHEAAILRGASDANIKDGDPAQVAAARAIFDFIERLEAERAGVVKQIEEQGGTAPDAPYKSADLGDLTGILRSEQVAAAPAGIHEEAGEVERVTPSVVAESLQKSAANTEFNPTQAKAWLFNEIDSALTKAPSSDIPEDVIFTEMKKKKMHTQRAVVIDGVTLYPSLEIEQDDKGFFIRAGREIMSIAPNLSTAKWEASRLLQSAEWSSGNGPTGKWSFDKSAIEDGRDYVTFDVPGDGKFKVLNTKEALQRFRDNVEKSPGFKKAPKPAGEKKTADWEKTGGAAPESTITEFLEDGEYTTAYEYARQIGKPFVFGFANPQAQSHPFVYLSAKPFEHPGFEGFKFVVGQMFGAKSNPWSVIDLSSGLAVRSGYATREKAITAARVALNAERGGEKQITPEKLQALIDSAFSKKEAGTQEQLADSWLKWADEKEGGGSVLQAVGKPDVAEQKPANDVSESDAAAAEARINQHGKDYRNDEGYKDRAIASIKAEVEHTLRGKDAGGEVAKRVSEAGERAIERIERDHVEKLAERKATNDVDFKGFEFDGDAGGKFTLTDGNMTVSVESMGDGKYQASFRGAKSSPQLQGVQGAVDWADAYRAESVRAQKKESEETAASDSGSVRNPEMVSMFAPYVDGDTVTLDGQKWQVKQDTNGWYLTNTGNWRGMHPTIRNIRAMADLIRDVEQAAVAKGGKKSVPPFDSVFVDGLTGEVIHLTDEQRKTIRKFSDVEDARLAMGGDKAEFALFEFDGSLYVAVTKPGDPGNWNPAKLGLDGKMHGAPGQYSHLMGFGFDDRRVRVLTQSEYASKQRMDAMLKDSADASRAEALVPTWYNYNGSDSTKPRSLVKANGRWYAVLDGGKLRMLGRRSGDARILDDVDSYIAVRKISIDNDGYVVFGENAAAGNNDRSTEAADVAPIAEAQAKQQMEWRNLGQTDGTKSHALFFYESTADFDGKTGGMEYGRVEQYDGGKWQFDGQSFDGLAEAKQAAAKAAIERLKSDGYVQSEAAKPQGEAPTNERLNMQHTRPLADLLTPAGAIKAEATKGKKAIWTHQGDPQHIQFAAKVTMGGEPAPADAVARWEKLKKAQEAGYRLANYRAGRLGTAWVLKRGDNVLTKDGFESFGSAVFDRPDAGPKEAGFDSMKSRQSAYATKLAEWFATLPASTLESATALATKIKQTPVGEWAKLGRSSHGEVVFSFRDKDGNDDVRVPGGESYLSQVHTIIALAGEAKNKGERAWFKVDSAADEKAKENIEAGVSPTDALRQYGFITESAAPAENADQTKLEAHRSRIARLYDGQLSLDELKAGFAEVAASRDAIVADLEGMTKDALLKMMGGHKAYQYKSDKKARVVEAVYEDMLSDYNISGGVSYMMGRDTYRSALQKRVDATTQQDMEAFAAKVAESRARSAANVEAVKRAMEDPQTLDDYRVFIRGHVQTGKTSAEARRLLPLERRVYFDDLMAEEARNARKGRTESAKSAVTAAAQTTAGKMFESKHTKTGEPLWVIQTADRVERDIYNQWNQTAKRLGGYYSSYRGNGAIPGFTFKSQDAAQAFMDYLGGDTTTAKQAVEAERNAFADDRNQSAVERLREMAGRLEDAASESLAVERKANTARRARFAASAEAAARGDMAMAGTMRNIASAIEDGTAKFLDRVRQKVQVEMLRSKVANAKYWEIREKYSSYHDQEQHKGEPATVETADYAKWPEFQAWRSDLARVARRMMEIDGSKRLGQSLLKIADDVTDEYKEFAKKNLYKVGTFVNKATGMPAVFSTADEAERAISRSNYRGKATTISFKRGEHIVIMGPEMAREAGIWGGGEDKLITISPEAGEEIVALDKQMGKRAGLGVPSIFESVSAERARWKAMGIETSAEMRAALREFVRLAQTPQKPDKIKEMERAMIGRKNDGLDFFPTSADVVDSMLEAAAIEPGMSVLEPSAGMGHIAEKIRDAGVDPDVIELSADRRDLLTLKGFNALPQTDFMELTPRGYTYGDYFRAKDGTEGYMGSSGGMGSNQVGLWDKPVGAEGRKQLGWFDRDELEGIRKAGASSGYDRIIMNPPFSNRRDAEHVQHAYTLLRPGGRIVAIMGEGVFFGQDAKAKAFREWLDSVGGTSEKLPEGSFLDPSLPVNTGVNARMVVIDKAESGDTVPAVLSRGDATANGGRNAVGVDTPTANAVVSRLLSSLGFSGHFSVVEKFADLPDSVKNSANRQTSDGDEVKGVFHGGAIYVIAGNNNSIADIEETVLHEALGHYGFRRLFGNEFIKEGARIFDSLGGVEGLSKIAHSQGFGGEFANYVRGVAQARGEDREAWNLEIAKLVLTEEIFAHMAESKPGVFDKFSEWIGQVRAWLRKKNFRELARYNIHDLRFMMKKIRETVKGGKKAEWRGRTMLPSVGDGRISDATVSDIRQALIDRFGERGIMALERSGMLKIAYADDLPASIRDYANAQNASAIYSPEGAAYLIADRMDADQAPAKLLHELGEHYGLERMLGNDGWARMRRRVAVMAKVRGSLVSGAWNGVLANYSEFSGMTNEQLAENDRFIHEVIAALGESEAGRKSSLLREILAAVKEWVSSLGLFGDWVTESDIPQLVAGSLRRVLREAEAGVVDRSKMSDVVSDNFEAIVRSMVAANEVIKDCA